MTQFQLEEGTQSPLRPRTATLNLAGPFTPPIDQGAVDWTADATRLTLVLDGEFMDDAMGHRGTQLGVNAPNLSLGPGIWEIRMEVIVDNVTSDIETVQLAITNAAGTTIHAESGSVSIPLSSSLPLALTALLDLAAPAGGGDIEVSFRAVQNSDTGLGTDLRILQNRVGIVRKIGNEGEIGV